MDYVDKIDRLRQRLRELQARKQKVDTRRRLLEGRRARREETRRLILIGAVALTMVNQGALDEALLREWLGNCLSREEDRALFKL